MFGIKKQREQILQLQNIIDRFERRFEFNEKELYGLRDSQRVIKQTVCTTSGDREEYLTVKNLHQKDAEKIYDLFTPGENIKTFEPVRLAVVISLILKHLNLGFK